MKLSLLGALMLSILICGRARAGDAVVVGYNAEGVWASVMYYTSSTAKGGADYKDEAGARAAAILDMKQRGGQDVVKTVIIASSDRTAHVAYARGQTKDGKDVHAVGYGATDAEAQKKAFDDLNGHGAKSKQKVFYRYFTHGGTDGTEPAKDQKQHR